MAERDIEEVLRRAIARQRSAAHPPSDLTDRIWTRINGNARVARYPSGFQQLAIAAGLVVFVGGVASGFALLRATRSQPSIRPAVSPSPSVKQTPPAQADLRVVAGNAATQFSGFINNIPAIRTALGNPAGVAVDRQGNVFIADNAVAARPGDAGCQVREVVVATGIIRAFAGTGRPGSSGDGGSAASAALGTCGGIAVSSEGDVYVSDLTRSLVRKVDGSTGIITTVAGGGSLLGPRVAGTAAQLNLPHGLAVDSSGNLYIADTGNNRICKLEPGGSLTTIAGSPTGNLGGPGGLTGDGGLAVQARLNSPLGVAIDANGNLYIADTANNVVRKVTAGDGKIDTIAGNGHPGVSGDGGPAAKAQLLHPQDVAIDDSGDLFIAEGEIREVLSQGGTIWTITGQAQPVTGAQELAMAPKGLMFVDTAGELVRMLVLPG
jgi:sugar lactone lactonase YvrE